jgi:hypothetical protein
VTRYFGYPQLLCLRLHRPGAGACAVNPDDPGVGVGVGLSVGRAGGVIGRVGRGDSPTHDATSERR